MQGYYLTNILFDVQGYQGHGGGCGHKRASRRFPILVLIGDSWIMEYSFLFLKILGFLTFKAILSSLLWKASMHFSKLVMWVQVSELYNRIGSI